MAVVLNLKQGDWREGAEVGECSRETEWKHGRYYSIWIWKKEEMEGKENKKRGGEKNIWKGKGLKKNSIWTLSRTKVVKSEIKVGVNRNIQISHGDGWKWKKDGMVTGVRMTHICLSRQPKSEINCFPETLDGMISAAPAWCSVFNDLTLGSWVKKKKLL